VINTNTKLTKRIVENAVESKSVTLRKSEMKVTREMKNLEMRVRVWREKLTVRAGKREWWQSNVCE